MRLRGRFLRWVPEVLRNSRLDFLRDSFWRFLTILISSAIASFEGVIFDTLAHVFGCRGVSRSIENKIAIDLLPHDSSCEALSEGISGVAGGISGLSGSGDSVASEGVSEAVSAKWSL